MSVCTGMDAKKLQTCFDSGTLCNLVREVKLVPESKGHATKDLIALLVALKSESVPPTTLHQCFTRGSICKVVLAHKEQDLLSHVQYIASNGIQFEACDIVDWAKKNL
jgi:hypothetical protein